MSTTLQENLEKYLKREGLYAVIAEYRRHALFTMPVLLMWVIGLWGPLAYFLLRHQGLRGLTAAILGPIALFLVTFLVLSVVFLIRQIRSGKKISQADAGFVGSVFLLYFPLAMTIALGIYLGSFLIAIAYIGIYVVVMAVVLLLQTQAYRVHLILELIRSIYRALQRSIALLLVLVPLLLVVTLLSVFSQELWQALGNLSISRLVRSIFLLAFPVLVLIVRSIDRETVSVIGKFPSTDQIAKNAQGTPYIQEKLDRGFISEEEWAWLIDQLKWRNLIKQAEELLPILRKKVKRWLGLLLILTSLALAIAFFIYFYLFFSVLLTPSLVETWTGIEFTTMIVPFRLFGQYVEIIIPSTAIATVKVALVLAVFVAMTSSVYALTDESIKAVFTEWLRQKVSSWQAISLLYLCVISPNYQIWKYCVRDKDQGIANVFIVVPKDSSEELVEKACEHMASRLDEYRHLVIITAFEEKPSRPVYELGMPGNRWRLLHNKSKGIREFEAIPLVLEDLRYQHFLGRDSLEKGTEIPEDWFGDTPDGKALAKSLWEEDGNHEWVLHPYVFTSEEFLSLEVSLAKRMSTSDQYREYVRRLLVSTRESISSVNTVLVELTFRDTLETLARVHWSEELSYVEYKDELTDRSAIEKPEVWE